MVLGSQSAPVLPPEPHNMLVVILCVVTALWMLSLRLKLRRCVLLFERAVTPQSLAQGGCSLTKLCYADYNAVCVFVLQRNQSESSPGQQAHRHDQRARTSCADVHAADAQSLAVVSAHTACTQAQNYLSSAAACYTEVRYVRLDCIDTATSDIYSTLAKRSCGSSNVHCDTQQLHSLLKRMRCCDCCVCLQARLAAGYTAVHSSS